MVKITFTVDEQTVEILKKMAERRRKPQSVIFREAIRHYSEHGDRLSDEERQRMLSVLDRVVTRKRRRTDQDVDAEIGAIRAARKTGGRRTPA